MSASIEEVPTQNQLIESGRVELLKVGDLVLWNKCPGRCAWANPFTITSIDGNYAMLDVYAHPVLLSELKRC